MKLVAAVESYIALRRSLGSVFDAESRILRCFGSSLGDICLDKIDPQVCRRFCQGEGAPSRWWERKHYALRDFFAFLVARGHLRTAPALGCCPKFPRTFEAYIYSREELLKLLAAAASLRDRQWPKQGLTFRILLLTLYGAGLRPGEGLRLRYCDVDLDALALSIWDTKFFKSRLVPVGGDLARALLAFQKDRQQLPMPEGERSAFFPDQSGQPIRLAKLERVFAQLRIRAGVRRPAGSRWQPRLHDLRHSFAVHRLVAWYREGSDVQACLPLLSTYLGHINISGTQTYLTMTPQLLTEAGNRFERYAAITHENHTTK
jgi:site-specific recombinase XerD